MAVTSGFFNSLNGDRRYTAEQFSALMDGLINNGVFANIGTAFSVKADTGNTIMVGVGRAWFNSAWVYNDAILPITLNNSEMLLDRIDAVVIEINHTESVRSGTIRIVQGAASSSPQKPTMTSLEDVHQYPLAYIYRTAGSSSISQSNIENAVGTSACPYVTGILQIQSIDNIVAQWESEFNAWMDGLEESLGDDPAVQLANRIISLESQFATLAKEGRVYADLEDSNSDKILDSEGRVIQGSTAFAYRGEGTSGAKISNEDLAVAISDLGDRLERFYKVGDIVTTMRTDFDDSWLLCNGAKLKRSDYMTLSEKIPKIPDNPNLIEYASILNISEIYRLKYVNGYYVALGRDGNYGTIAIRTGINSGSMRKIYIWESTDNDEKAMVCDLLYNGTYYVAVGYRRYGSVDGVERHEARIAYSSTLDGNGEVTWTSAQLWEGAVGCIATSIAKFGNYYVIGGGIRTFKDDSNNCIIRALVAYATTPTTSAWTQNHVSSSTISNDRDQIRRVDDLLYDETRSRLLLSVRDGYNTEAYYIDSVSNNAVSIRTVGTPIAVGHAGYIPSLLKKDPKNDRFFLLGNSINNTNGTLISIVPIANEGGYTYKDTNIFPNEIRNYAYFSDVLYDGNYYIIIGTARDTTYHTKNTTNSNSCLIVGISKEIADRDSNMPMKWITFRNVVDYDFYKPTNALVGEDCIYFNGQQTKPEDISGIGESFYSALGCRFNLSYFILPEYSDDSSYQYIKAK